MYHFTNKFQTLLCIYIYIFIAITSFSVPMKGRPKTSHVYSYHCFFPPCGPPLPLAYKFIS